MTLNFVRPFDYDPDISAYEGLYGFSFNFRQHPIAPVGTNVLTWDAPDHHGSWADHGVPAVYLGPAPNHVRAFMHDVSPDAALLEIDLAHAYLPRKKKNSSSPKLEKKRCRPHRARIRRARNWSIPDHRIGTRYAP
jgi:hypothetical protein